MRSLLIGGVLFTLLAAIISWLMTSQTSPLSDYLLWHPQMRNFWGTLNFPAFLAGAVVAGNPHSFNDFAVLVVFFIQWMLIGILLTAVGKKFLGRKAK